MKITKGRRKSSLIEAVRAAGSEFSIMGSGFGKGGQRTPGCIHELAANIAADSGHENIGHYNIVVCESV